MWTLGGSRLELGLLGLAFCVHSRKTQCLELRALQGASSQSPQGSKRGPNMTLDYGSFSSVSFQGTQICKLANA